MLGWHRAQADPSEAAADAACSFCKRKQAEVDHLIAGPAVMICDACVMVCLDILNKQGDLRRSKAQEAEAGPGSEATPEATRPRWHSLARCRLCGIPLNLEEAIVVPDVAVLCRPCVTAIQASTDLQPTEIAERSIGE
jgi:hypothetical protein